MALSFEAHSRLEARVNANLQVARQDPQGYERRVARWLWLGEKLCALADFLRLTNEVHSSGGANAARHQDHKGGRAQSALVDAEPKQSTSSAAKSRKANSFFNHGRVLAREDAPTLFAIRDDLCARVGIKTAPEIVLCWAPGAVVELGSCRAVQYVPSGQMSHEDEHDQDLAPVTRSGNRLGIGRNLLHETSVEELRAILAHELGHVVGRQTQLLCKCHLLHRRLATIGARQSPASAQGGAVREKSGMINILARIGARRFNQFLWVRVFPLFRNSEWEADSYAAHLVGRELVGQALIRTAIAQKKYHCFLSDLVEELEAKGFGKGHDLLDERILALLLSEKTNGRSTHPCLCDRLSALNVTPRVPPPLTVSAMSLLREEQSPPVPEKRSLSTWLRRKARTLRFKALRALR